MQGVDLDLPWGTKLFASSSDAPSLSVEACEITYVDDVVLLMMPINSHLLLLQLALTLPSVVEVVTSNGLKICFP